MRPLQRESLVPEADIEVGRVGGFGEQLLAREETEEVEPVCRLHDDGIKVGITEESGEVATVGLAVLEEAPVCAGR